MNYIKETTNNYSIASIKLQEKGIVQVACIYCVEIYPIVRNNQLKTITNNTLICNTCNNETMVPIVPNSVLQTQCKNFGEQVKKIQEWNKEAFEIIDDESDYEDYEYEENNLLSDDMFRADYYGEEMKDALQQEI